MIVLRIAREIESLPDFPNEWNTVSNQFFVNERRDEAERLKEEIEAQLSPQYKVEVYEA